MLRYMGGFNSEKLSKGKNEISSFIVCTGLRTGGCDGRCLYNVLD
jgi:hypothetical protein